MKCYTHHFWISFISTHYCRIRFFRRRFLSFGFFRHFFKAPLSVFFFFYLHHVFLSGCFVIRHIRHSFFYLPWGDDKNGFCCTFTSFILTGCQEIVVFNPNLDGGMIQFILGHLAGNQTTPWQSNNTLICLVGCWLRPQGKWASHSHKIQYAKSPSTLRLNLWNWSPYKKKKLAVG